MGLTMLIEFAVENYRSIKNEVVLSLVADNGKELLETNVTKSESTTVRRPIATVRSAVIYGANGAGKTNLLRAIGAMELIVNESAKGLTELPVESFHFDEDYRIQPTTFDTTVIGPDGVRYRFGFKATKEAIVEEWLYAWPLGRVQKWYSRRKHKFDFGEKLSGDKEVWRRATRPDALFLSTAISLNSEQLKPVNDWFTRNLRVSRYGRWNPSFTIDRYESGHGKSILRFLHSADIAISDVSISREEFNPDMLPKDMPESLKRELEEKLSGKELSSVFMTHVTDDGSTGEIDLDEESDGTQKIFALAGPWIDALENGYTVVLDELHDNLHPNLVRFLVDCFHNPRLNRKGAQLVFSTHETSILTNEIFRRDQIWFCERDGTLATSLYALNEFKVRPGVVNLERAYLSGRYGALPFIKSDQLIEHAAS